ncbi:MAG: beta strand repeat-containing protein [Panacagrimonas sp.]
MSPSKPVRHLAGVLLCAALPFSVHAQSAVTGLGKGLGNVVTGLLGAQSLNNRSHRMRGPLGITVLQEGADGSGIANVLDLGGARVVGDQLDNVLVTPLLGLDGNNGLVDIAVLDGNGTARAADNGLASVAVLSGSRTGNGGLVAVGLINGDNTGNTNGLAGVAVLSGNNAANGPIGIGILNGDNTGNSGVLAGIAALSGDNAGNGPIGVGILNGDNSGNGRLIGVAALSGTNAGNSDNLGVSLLNKDTVLKISLGDMSISAEDLVQAALTLASMFPLVDEAGIAVGGGADARPMTHNPLLNVGALTGDNAGTGGLIGVGVLAGDNSGTGSLLGICVLCGDNSGTGIVGAAVLSGDNSGISKAIPTEAGTIPGLAGVGVLTGDNSGTGGLVSAAVLAGDNSGNGSIVGAAALSGSNTGNSDLLGVGVLNKAATGNGQIGVGALNDSAAGNGEFAGIGVLNGAASGNGGIIGFGVLNGEASGNGGVVAVGALNGAASGNGGLIGAGVLNGANSGNGLIGLGLINRSIEGLTAVAANSNTEEEVCTVVVRDGSGASRTGRAQCRAVLPAFNSAAPRSIQLGALNIRPVAAPAVQDQGTPPCTVIVLDGLGSVSQSSRAVCTSSGV